MAANYFLSSAPGQACAWRVRPHFRLEEKKEEEVEEDGGRERGRNVNPPPMKKS